MIRNISFPPPSSPFIPMVPIIDFSNFWFELTFLISMCGVAILIPIMNKCIIPYFSSSSASSASENLIEDRSRESSSSSEVLTSNLAIEERECEKESEEIDELPSYSEVFTLKGISK